VVVYRVAAVIDETAVPTSAEPMKPGEERRSRSTAIGAIRWE
jgi:hypothetical protein